MVLYNQAIVLKFEVGYKTVRWSIRTDGSSHGVTQSSQHLRKISKFL